MPAYLTFSYQYSLLFFIYCSCCLLPVSRSHTPVLPPLASFNYLSPPLYTYLPRFLMPASHALFILTSPSLSSSLPAYVARFLMPVFLMHSLHPYSICLLSLPLPLSTLSSCVSSCLLPLRTAIYLSYLLPFSQPSSLFTFTRPLLSTFLSYAVFLYLPYLPPFLPSFSLPILLHVLSSACLSCARNPHILHLLTF